MKNLGIETMFDIDNACACLKKDEGTKREWTAIGPIEKDEDCEVVAEYVAYCHPDNAKLFAAAPKMLAILKELMPLGMSDCSNSYEEEFDLAEKIIQEIES